MSLTSDINTGDNDAILMKMGPWLHVMRVVQELDISVTGLANIIEANQLAYFKPEQYTESRIYLHKDWVNAAKSKFPIVKHCMLQRHLLMDDLSWDELRLRIPRKRPRDVADKNQIATLKEILDSDFILQGERNWILPIFDERWIGSVRINALIRYFNGLKVKKLGGSYEYISQGVFNVRAETLAKFHDSRKELELINDDTF
ncbi:MAG: hypothetical protein HOB84_11340 [Candidatus Marinimicrobia bacterium]|nr:hypothetical protein [Candidatus Neomarinimicrobiota bacterium]MBT4715356.1 hypothetical protein [Candidatus Neomarinimicrobiota bacterium]